LAGSHVYVGSISAGLLTTGPDGSATFTGVPATANGRVGVLTLGQYSYLSVGHTFTAEGPNHVVVRPGRIGVQLALHEGEGPTSQSWFEAAGTGGLVVTYVSGFSGAIYAVPPDCTWAVFYAAHNKAVEWFASPGLAIAPGHQAGPITFDEYDTLSTWPVTPRWDSVSPGRTVKVALHNWPQGSSVKFRGLPMAPGGASATLGSATASGDPVVYKSVQIPASATPGYRYVVQALRKDSGSRLALDVRLQLASLKSSKASIYKGDSFRLSGVVPTEGHSGTTPGKSKYVTLYKRTTSAGVPAFMDATRSGWTKVGTYKADGYGKYRTGLFSPKRTTWYIVRYPGDTQYQRGFTSVLKVPVK
jgi:hypothetical protein